MTDAATSPAPAPVTSGSPAGSPTTPDPRDDGRGTHGTGDGTPVAHGTGGGDAEALLVVGVGASTGVPAAEVFELVESALREAGRSVRDLAALATVDVRAGEPGLVEAARRLGVPMVTYSARQLARVAVPHPSDAPFAALGTTSVAEAAALIGGGELVVPKRRSAGTPARATCAVACRPGLPALPDA
ncbi:cobalamin biosynthesis protein, partial [Streptomyces sp. ID05-04B]|uniref:cobalamin biosynthesis protein n=1 Tax=Streptomyces sp. ID05-04B TaxID=3028661 RepID=UPI0029C1C882